MIEMIKNKIWDLLKEKEISLAMIYDQQGKILWHKGRKILDTDVFTGEGFCKSYITKSLENPVPIDVENYIKSIPEELSPSAQTLMVKSVMIHPVKPGFFLYVDSGKKEYFSETDRASLRILGELLEQMILQIQTESDAAGISGSSIETAGIRQQVARYSLEEEPVLLTGETGVGKNHIAALIHRFSGKRGKFVIVDTPNISDNLFESKLFGHKKGAFTDARFDKTGLVEEATGGTLFFDEITEVPMEVQAKLLRFMDTRKYYVLGESTEKQVDVRIIAATNRNLKEAVENKIFRQDLYYRLNVLEIPIPPLRQRKDDIKHFVREHQILLRGKEIGSGFWEVMTAYHWPGNVRELLNILKRAGIMLDSPITGEKIAALLDSDPGKSPISIESVPHPNSNLPTAVDTVDAVDTMDTREKIAAGANFWEVIWNPFIHRDMDRNTVKRILKDFYSENAHSFKKLTGFLNVAEKDYKKFMSLLYKYKIDPRK